MAETNSGLEQRWRHAGRIDVVMLAYLLLLLLQPAATHASPGTWALTLAGMALGALLVLGTRGASGGRRYAVIAAMAALGGVFTPTNWCGFIYFVYAATLAGRVTPPRRGAIAVGVLLAFVLALSAVGRLPVGVLLPAFLCTAVGGGIAITVAQKQAVYFQLLRAQEEVQRLAAVAERERIARDLHDVLGHTLSVIILKSELAAKLALHDPQRAQGEMADVERTAREALGEIRDTIRGYRAQGLPAELERARQTLATAGVEAECHAAEVALDGARETVLALVVREAVTNVVRHAVARHCRLDVTMANGHCRLEVTDDGRGASGSEGNGLRGMRERVEALGGTLALDGSRGTRLTVTLPVGAAEEGR